MTDTISPVATVNPTHEYAMLTGDHLLARLNDLELDGWHLVNVIAAEAGWTNKFAAVVRREIVPLPAPDTTEFGWYPDPTHRHAQRYWDGHTWTHNVSDNGKVTRDSPTLLVPTPGLTYQ